MSEAAASPVPGDLHDLHTYLSRLLPEYSPEQQLRLWLVEKQAELVPLDLGADVPGTAKEVFSHQQFPEVIIKRYRPGDALTATKERELFAMARQSLTTPLVETEFVSVDSEGGPVAYQLQNRLYGKRFKHIVDRLAMERFIELHTSDPARAAVLGRDPTSWLEWRRTILREELGECLPQASEHISELVHELQELERQGHYLHDLDFFIADDGAVTLFELARKERAEDQHEIPEWSMLAQLFSVRDSVAG